MEDKDWKSLGALGAAITALIGFFSSFLKSRTDKRLKELDVSTGWQAQMLERIQHLEVKLEQAQTHIDEVEWDARLYREKVKDLQDEIVAVREQHKTTELELQRARHKISNLERQRDALAHELKEMHRSLRSGGVHGLPRGSKEDG